MQIYIWLRWRCEQRRGRRRPRHSVAQIELWPQMEMHSAKIENADAFAIAIESLDPECIARVARLALAIGALRCSSSRA